MSGLTIDYLREILLYKPETGVLSWKKTRGGRIAGTQAGWIGSSRGYRHVGIDGKSYLEHRIAWAITYGEWPRGELDHINHIRSDNRLSNLRLVTHQQNHKNKSIPSDNKSGVMGVIWNKRDSKWYSYIRINGKQVHLGRYENIFDAACARKSAENKHGFHLNHGSPFFNPKYQVRNK